MTFNDYSGRDHSDFQILAGWTNRIDGAGDIQPVSEVREHEAYDDWELWNDVVILKLPTHLTEGTNIRHANLPPPGHFIPSGLTVSVNRSQMHLFHFSRFFSLQFLAGEPWNGVQAHSQQFYNPHKFQQ